MSQFIPPPFKVEFPEEVALSDRIDGERSDVAATENAVATLNRKVNKLQLPIGVPIYWPSTSVPNGYLPMHGQAFDKSVYTELAIVYPSGVLPDSRNDYFRVAPNGVAPLSRQSQSVQPLGFVSDPHAHGTNATAYGSIYNGYERTSGYPEYRAAASVYSATVTGRITGTGSETRPRSLLWNCITRAL